MINSESELDFNVEKCKKELSRSLYKLILNSINYENLKPGIKINILKLSKNIGVKKTPVTEALNLLSDYGLLEKSVDKNEFYTISKYSEDIIQIYYARSILESNAAFLCARQYNCPNIEKLKQIIIELKNTMS
jgi:DNA-binding GntR family transcriptional regulator